MSKPPPLENQEEVDAYVTGDGQIEFVWEGGRWMGQDNYYYKIGTYISINHLYVPIFLTIIRINQDLCFVVECVGCVSRIEGARHGGCCNLSYTEEEQVLVQTRSIGGGLILNGFNARKCGFDTFEQTETRCCDADLSKGFLLNAKKFKNYYRFEECLGCSINSGKDYHTCLCDKLKELENNKATIL